MIDHVILVVPDLDEARRRLRDEHGLDSYAGGDHPAFGTGNAIVPLGDAYLELMSVTAPEVAAANPLGQAVAARIASGGWSFLGWVVATDHIESDAARIGSWVVPGERVRTDGRRVAWRLAGIEHMLADPSMPFFITWDDHETHPAREPVRHAVDVAGIAWLEVAGDHAALDARLGDHDLPLRVVGGEPGARAVGIATARGEIVLREGEMALR